MNAPVNQSLELMLITDLRETRGSFFEIMEQALAGGVTALQLREPEISAKELYQLALEAREITRKHDGLLIVNDRLDVALAAEADGVHLGWRSLPVEAARKAAGRSGMQRLSRFKESAGSMLVGFSAHNLEEAQTAQTAGADYITLSPVFPTPSKKGLVPVLGLDAFADIIGRVDLPVVGLGGVDASNAREVRDAGACGIAVVRAIWQADDPMEAASVLRREFP